MVVYLTVRFSNKEKKKALLDCFIILLSYIFPFPANLCFFSSHEGLIRLFKNARIFNRNSMPFGKIYKNVHFIRRLANIFQIDSIFKLIVSFILALFSALSCENCRFPVFVFVSSFEIMEIG